MKINKYPDGASYVTDVDAEHIVFKINSYEDLWHLNQYVDAFNSKFGYQPDVTISSLLDSQADKRYTEDQSFGLNLVCQFLNSMDVKMFFIFHPHNPEFIKTKIENVKIIDNSELITKVFEKISENNSPNWSLETDLTVMASDQDSFRNLTEVYKKINWKGDLYSTTKPKSWNTEGNFIQKIDRKDFKGKDVLIVNDICIYGETYKKLSQLLRSKNVGKMHLLTSHMTVQYLERNPVTDYFDTVFTSNSKFGEYFAAQKNSIGGEYLAQPKNLHIIPLFKFKNEK